MYQHHRNYVPLPDFVVCAYEDGALQKFTPIQITTKFFRPRFSLLESYYGIEEVQKGLMVRCFWNNRFPHSKASIIGVESATAMDELYEKVTFESGRGDNMAVIYHMFNELLYLAIASYQTSVYAA